MRLVLIRHGKQTIPFRRQRLLALPENLHPYQLGIQQAGLSTWTRASRAQLIVNSPYTRALHRRDHLTRDWSQN